MSIYNFGLIAVLIP